MCMCVYVCVCVCARFRKACRQILMNAHTLIVMCVVSWHTIDNGGTFITTYSYSNHTHHVL